MAGRQVMKLAHSLADAESALQPEQESSDGRGGEAAISRGLRSAAMIQHTGAAFRAAPRFLILDFRSAPSPPSPSPPLCLLPRHQD